MPGALHTNAAHQSWGRLLEADYILLGKYLRLRPKIRKAAVLVFRSLFSSQDALYCGSKYIFPKVKQVNTVMSHLQTARGLLYFWEKLVLPAF